VSIKSSGSRSAVKFTVGGIKGCVLLLSGLIKPIGSRNSMRFDEEEIDKDQAFVEVLSFRSSGSGFGRSMMVIVGEVSI